VPTRIVPKVDLKLSNFVLRETGAVQQIGAGSLVLSGVRAADDSPFAKRDLLGSEHRTRIEPIAV
jgi:hypothetical protein